MAKVYRIASRYDGRGPFNTTSPDYCVFEALQYGKGGSNGHPAPFDDGLPFDGYDATTVYGCATKEQLDGWFGEAWRRQYGDKFDIEVHRIPDRFVERGGHQVRFEPTRVTKTERYPANTPLEAIP